MITMKIDAGQSRISSSVLKKLGDKADKVVADATNRALAGMRTDGTKLIVKESGIVRKKVFSAFTIIKASASGQTHNARVEITGNPIFLNCLCGIEANNPPPSDLLNFLNCLCGIEVEIFSRIS